MEFLLRFKPLKQKVTYLRTEKNNKRARQPDYINVFLGLKFNKWPFNHSFFL